MLTSIRIKGFRKFSDFAIGDFARINFILGNNNVGKTTILESICAWANGRDFAAHNNRLLNRGRYYGNNNTYWMMEEVKSLFRDQKSLPFSLGFTGIFDGKEDSFIHTVYPSEWMAYYDSYKKLSNIAMLQSKEDIPKGIAPFISMRSTEALHPQSVTVARWEIKHDGNVATQYITNPMSTLAQEKPFKPNAFIDILSQTSVAEFLQMYSF